MVGGNEPTEMDNARSKQTSLCMNTGRNSLTTVPIRARGTIACAEHIPPKSATASFR